MAVDVTQKGVYSISYSGKKGEGNIDSPIEFGGVSFAPGQWIYSDEDGIAIAPHELSGS